METVLESTLTPPKHISAVEPRSAQDDLLFSELASVLKKHKALDRFGITLLHRHFDIAPGECLLESTKVKQRVQTIQPVSHSELRKEDYIETSWRLGDNWIAMACVCVKMGDDHQHHSRG